MVAAFDYCLYGRGGAAPVDRHRDARAGRRRRTSTTCTPTRGSRWRPPRTARQLTRECFGDRVVWVPWRRPGFQLGLDIAAIRDEEPAGDRGASSAATASPPGAPPARSARRNSLEIIRTAQRFLAERGRRRAVRPGRARQRAAARGRAAGQGGRDLPDAARAGLHRRPPGRPLHRQRRRARLPGPARSCARWPRWAPPARTTSCARRSRRWSSTCPATATAEEIDDRLRELHAALPGGLPGLLRAARRPPTSPPMRGADPAIVLVPGVGMFCFGRDKQTARVAGEFYVNAINVMRGAEAVSTYAPIPESEKFRIEYWALEEAKLARMPKPKPLATRVALRHRRGVRASARPSPSGSRPRAPAWSSPTSTRRRPAEAAAVDRVRRRRGRASPPTCPTRRAVAAALRGRRARVRRGGPGGQQRRPVDLQAAAGDHRRRTGTCSTT